LLLLLQRLYTSASFELRITMKPVAQALVLMLACLMSQAWAQGGATRTSDLKLIPEPKQVKRQEGAFRVTRATRIIVHPSYAKEDRTAVEMLAEEINSMLVGKIAVVSGTAPVPGSIYLTRLTRPGERKRLEASGFKVEGKLDPESYFLLADNNKVIVAGGDSAGTFYGVQTLRQLLRPSGIKLIVPALAIWDWPTMKIRGVHDDISRGPVPTMDYIKQQIRTLSEYKVNMLGLYIEHIFDYQSQPLIAPKEGALTAAQVKEIVAYAQRYHITLLPEQQAFGHLHHVLKYDLYQDVSETPHGHVLTPTKPQSYELIKSLYGELIPLFPGPYFHIGADETWELGQGQTKARADEVGLGKVYLEHLQKVAEIVKPYHKRLMFWGDIAVKYPELLSILPKDVIAVPWNYGARDSFTNMIQPFKDAGLDIVIAPGANNWNRPWPDLDTAFVNIRNFTRDGHKFNALGMLNTTWDDDGEALFGATWPALVFGAGCAWQDGECSIEDFQAKYDWAFYRNADSSFSDAIKDLSRTHGLLKSIGVGGADDDMLWADPFTQLGAQYVKVAAPVAPELRKSAERALVTVYSNTQKARLHRDTLPYLVFAGRWLDLLGMKIEFTDEINRFYWDAYQNSSDRGRVRRDLREINGINARLQDLRDATTGLRGAYTELWLKENRPYWLGNVTVKYDHLSGLFQTKIDSMKMVDLTFRLQQKLAAPEELGFYAKPDQPPSAPASAPAKVPESAPAK
jgi:hexosaminidase